ncbi:MAG: hypothetical protein AAF086_05010 [Planctomycetota bacterium]
MQYLIDHHFEIIFKIFLVAILFIGGAIVGWSRSRKRVDRIEQLRSFAVHRQWSFDPGPESYEEFVCPIPCRKRRKLISKPENIIRGEIAGLDIAVFDDILVRRDYQGVENPEQQTVVAIRLSDLETQSIIIKPKSQLHSSDQYKPIDLSPWPTLDKIFVMIAPEKSIAKVLLTPRLVGLLETQPQHTLQLEGGWILFSAQNCTAKVHEIDLMIERLFDIAELLVDTLPVDQSQSA